MFFSLLSIPVISTTNSHCAEMWKVRVHYTISLLAPLSAGRCGRARGDYHWLQIMCITENWLPTFQRSLIWFIISHILFCLDFICLLPCSLSSRLPSKGPNLSINAEGQKSKKRTLSAFLPSFLRIWSNTVSGGKSSIYHSDPHCTASLFFPH